MKEKTKNYKWLPWAVAIAVAVVVAMLTGNFGHWYVLDPWSNAQGLVTKLAISTFQGISDTAHHWDARFYTIIALILSFIIGPSLWIYAEIKNQSKDDQAGNSLNKGIVWYIGIIIVILSLQVVPSAIMKGFILPNSWKSAAASRNEDKLRMGLVRLGMDAYQHYYLPHKFGGGAQSFRSMPSEGKGMRAIKLTDLENYNENASNSYQLAPVESDSAILIYGVGNKQGPDPDFKNVNGQKGKLQLALKVTPGDGMFHFSYENVNKR